VKGGFNGVVNANEERKNVLKGSGCLCLLHAIVKQAVFDIWEYNRLEVYGQKNSETYYAVNAAAYRKKIIKLNYKTATEFIVKFFGEEMLRQIEASPLRDRLKKAA
jgi:hypothetical protein